MVVAATDFYKALSDPLQAIQDLYEREGDKANFSSLVGSHFQSLFQERDSRAKITPLTQSLLRGTPHAESGPSTQTARLVRWRCMIQDTSLGSELMPRRFKGPQGNWRNGLFGASGLIDDQLDAEPDVSPNQLSSLNTLFGVSLPGQSKWSQLADERLDSSVEADLSSKMQNVGLDGAHTPIIKAKLPTGQELGVLLKVYDEDLAESVRVAQAVDVIGILDHSSLPSAEWSSSLVEEGEEASSTLYPALHVITMQRADLQQVGEAATSGNEAEIKEALIDYLSQGVQGDRVAAEWLLLSLISRIHTRTTSHILGPLSLNISGYQAASTSEARPLSLLLSDILPLVVNQSLELTHLNDKATQFSPKSQADELGLQAGRLQLVDGTLLLIDENSMQEGQLKENGIENIRNLSNLLTTRKLSYTFPYNNLEMETDLNCVVLSQGKSFLPVDVQLPLRPPMQRKNLATTTTGNSTSKTDHFSILDYRHYLGSIQFSSSQAKYFTISNEISDKIQTDFVESRSRGSAIKKASKSTAATASVMESQEDLSRAIHIARLLCLSRGGNQLNWQDWEGAKSLEAERSSRLQQQ